MRSINYYLHLFLIDQLLFMRINVSSIKLSENPVFHKRSKHIAIRHHFLRQFVEENIVKFEYIKSLENIADILTKPLHKNQFRLIRAKLMGVFTVLL